MDSIGNVQLIAGDSSTVSHISALLKKEGIETAGNLDVYIREYASFGVEEARELAQKAASRAVSSARRVFIVVTPSMTSEAQNALLKTLEEPAGEALFFLVVPSPQQLLPTLRSRAQILSFLPSVQVSKIDAKLFLSAKPQKRIDMLKPLLEKDDDDKRDVGAAIAFLSSLEREFSSNVQKSAEGLEALYRARKYLGDKGSLQKALLEQVALLV